MNSIVSIIVPFYNAEKFIAQCIQSIKNQTYKHWELILVNDGSTDKSTDIAKLYSKQDDRIHLIFQKNAGVSAARNKGLASVKGDFICFCDVDDYYESNALELMVNSFSDSVDIVKCNFIRIIKGETIKNKSCFKGLYWNNQIIESVIPEYLSPINIRSKGEFCSIWGCLFRTTLLTNINFISTEVMEDKVFWLEALSSARGIFYLDIPLYVYNWIPNSAMNRYHKDYSQNVIFVLQSIDKFLKKRKIYDYCKERFTVLKVILFQAIIYNELISNNSIIKSVREIRKCKKFFLPNIPSAISKDLIQIDFKWLLMKYDRVFEYFSLKKLDFELRAWIRRILRR